MFIHQVNCSKILKGKVEEVKQRRRRIERPARVWSGRAQKYSIRGGQKAGRPVVTEGEGKRVIENGPRRKRSVEERNLEEPSGYQKT